MAINFLELKAEYDTAQLTTDEITMVNALEKYIDYQMKKDFTGGSVLISSEYFGFMTILKNKMPMRPKNPLKPTRISLMQKELIRRYALAGWQTNTGSQYTVFTGIQK